MIKGIVSAWSGIQGIAITHDLLQRLDLFIDQIFDEIDTEKKEQISEEQYVLATKKNPDVLNIFDFLNKVYYF